MVVDIVDLIVTRMSRKQYSQQAAPVVVLGVGQTGADLPVHMPALPCAWTYQYDRYGYISYEIIADLSADLVWVQIFVNVAVAYGPVYNAAAQHIDKLILVFFIFAMEGHEHLVSGRVGHDNKLSSVTYMDLIWSTAFHNSHTS